MFCPNQLGGLIGTKNGERNAKKSSGLLCEKSEVKYEFIESHSEYPVTKWAVILGVSTSAYYDWLRTKEKRDRKRKEYANEIKRIFSESNNTYGVDRVCGALRKRGFTASY